MQLQLQLVFLYQSPEHQCKIRFYLILLEKEEDKGAHSLPLSLYMHYLHGMHARRFSFLDYSPSGDKTHQSTPALRSLAAQTSLFYSHNV